MSRNNRELDALVIEAEPLIMEMRTRAGTEEYRAAVQNTIYNLKAALDAMHVAAKSLALLKLDGRHRSYINLCVSPDEPDTDAIAKTVDKIIHNDFNLKYLSMVMGVHTFSEKAAKNKYEVSLPTYLDETNEFIDFFERHTGEKVIFPKRDPALFPKGKGRLKREKGWEHDYKYIDQPSTYFVCKCLEKLDPEKNKISRGITLIRYALEHRKPAMTLMNEILSRKD